MEKVMPVESLEEGKGSSPGLACRRGKRGGHDRQKEQHRQRKQRQETAVCLGAVLLLTCGE